MLTSWGFFMLCLNSFQTFCCFRSEIYALYPNKFVQLDENRIYVLNTLFNLPGTYALQIMLCYLCSAKYQYNLLWSRLEDIALQALC